MGEAVVRVLLVDDQELIRTGLRRILRRKDGFDIVGECADGDEVASAVALHSPDIVVMDLRMRRMGGIEATRALGRSAHGPPVLALTTYRDDELISGVLRAGASGFVLKDSPAEELIREVRLVAAGESVLDPAITERVLRTYRAAPAPSARTTDLDRLTDRERQVLAGVGRGLTNDEIAARLSISVVTVKSHIGSIFAKLGVRDRAAAVVYAFDHGVVAPGG